MSETKTITIKEANDFANNVNFYLADKGETKFTYALKKVLKRIEKAAEKHQDEYNEEMVDVNVSLASTDKNGNIIYETETVIELNGNKKEVNTQSPKYTPDKLREKNKKQNELGRKLLNTEIEFEPYIATEVPELTDEEKENFAGFVI